MIRRVCGRLLILIVIVIVIPLGERNGKAVVGSRRLADAASGLDYD